MKSLLISIFCFVAFSATSQKVELLVKQASEMCDKGNYKGALVNFNEAVKLAPKNGVLYTGRGIVRKNLMDYKGAMEDYNTAIILNPKDADAYCNRGISKIALDNADGACSDFKKAEKFGKQGASALIKKFCKKN